MTVYRWRLDSALLDQVRDLVWAVRGTRHQTTIRAVVAGGLRRALLADKAPRPSRERAKGEGRRRDSVWSGVLDDDQVQALYDRCEGGPPWATDLLEAGIRNALRNKRASAKRDGAWRDSERPRRLPGGRPGKGRA